ncbi:MAG TPA: hypothetical protein PK530_03745 [Anaerolineales bacterium]|nr:hypothetical protein [Anaerolineales bacterium]
MYTTVTQLYKPWGGRKRESTSSRFRVRYQSSTLPTDYILPCNQDRLYTGQYSIRYKQVSLTFVLAWLVAVFYLNSCSMEDNHVNSEHSFEIAFLGSDLDPNNFSKRLGHTLESSWVVLKEAYPSKVKYSLTVDDIETYNWSEQVITLTPEATNNLIEHFDCHAYVSFDCLYHHAFVVIFDGVPKYGGLFFPNPYTQESIDYPLIYPRLVGNEMELQVLPYLGFAFIQPPEGYTIPDEDWRTIKDEDIRVYFKELGKLVP